MDIQMMTLGQVQDIVRSSCDFGDMETPEQWQMMIHCKAADSGFGYLMENMARIGWSPTHPVPIYDGMICEAHHRLVAAILLCMDEIPVTLGGKYREDRKFGPSGHDGEHRYHDRGRYGFKIGECMVADDPWAWCGCKHM